MGSEHIYRDFSSHTKHTRRPDEYCKVEIFSYNHQYTQTYHYNNYSFNTDNSKRVSHRSMYSLQSKDTNPFSVGMLYNVLEEGEYRIDIIYENMDSEDIVGSYEFDFDESSINSNMEVSVEKDLSILNPKIIRDNLVYITDVEREIAFDGEKNVIKRKTIFENLKKGSYNFTLHLPYNVYFIGVIIRKIIRFVGDNLQSVGTNLQFKEASVTSSSMTDPSEAIFKIGYSQTFDCMLSRTNLYFDYMDEVNLYFKEDGEVGGAIHQRFGGYISSVKLNEDRTTIDFSCGDRLIDGEHKYILDSLLILDGTTSQKEMDYYEPINFESYGEAIKYIADIYEITLNTNINKSYLVEGEKYNTGLSIKFGTDGDVKKVTTSNAEATMNKKSVTLRNNSSGKKVQSITLYQAPRSPVLLRKWEDKDNHKNNFMTFHMVYGLGDTKTEIKTTVTETKDTSASGQSYTKCGVSADGKYIMAIGLPSAGKDSKSGWTKAIFERKCPHCGSTNLVWDIFYGSWGYASCKGSNEGGGIEGHIFCKSCDADYSCQGHEHIGGSKYSLKRVGDIVSSSKSEAQKLRNGEFKGSTTSTTTTSSSSVLESVAKIAKQYEYRDGGNATTYSKMKKTGYGDSRGFSDLIYSELKSYKVSCRIYEDVSGHHAVQYLNAKNQWVSFPYSTYDLYTSKLKFKTNFSSVGKTPIKEYKGSSIANAKAKTSSSSTTTQTTTTSEGYDKDKPIQGYIELTYSYEKSLTAKTYVLNLDFTQKAGTTRDLSGLTNIWVNNATRKTSINLSDFFDDIEPNKDIYLHQIRFVAPKIKTTTADENTDWYTFDKSTKDYSSCKMDLYQIIFDDGIALNPQDLQACGKTVSSMLKELVEASNYYMERVYAQHRCDDKINLSIQDKTKIKYFATEGDNNNILSWSSINYNPVSDLRNKSICVFKKSDGKYAYVDTTNIESLLKYSEQTTLQTVSDQIGSKEAYYNARSSKEFNPEEIYSYTIVVPYAPLLSIEDQIRVVSNNKQLNDIKTVKSLKISYENNRKPMIRSEIGCDEIEPFLRIKKHQEELRREARSDETYFGRTASPIDDEELYIWEN